MKALIKEKKRFGSVWALQILEFCKPGSISKMLTPALHLSRSSAAGPKSRRLQAAGTGKKSLYWETRKKVEQKKNPTNWTEHSKK